MDKPTQIPFDVTLKVSDELDRKDILRFVSTVKKHAPSGILAPYNRTFKSGERADIYVVQSVTDDNHLYQVPLKRNLEDSEAKVIVDAWAKVYEDDFDIEATSALIPIKDLINFDEVDVDDSYEQYLIDNTVSTKHNRWMVEQVEEGWRYGMEYDKKEKIHPFLRPWEQLSQRDKQVFVDKVLQD